MAEQIVERMGTDPLRFQGTVIAELETEQIAAEDGARWVQLALYGCDGGGFVARTTYRTTVNSEQSVSSAERLDTATDAENFFFAFEPDEFLQRANVHLKEVDRQQLAADIYSRYEIVMQEMLVELPSAPGKESQPDVKATDAARNSSTGVAR